MYLCLQLAQPTLTGPLEEGKAAVTQNSQESSQPSPTMGEPTVPVVTQSTAALPAPLSHTEDPTSTNCTREGNGSNMEKTSHEHKIAPSFGKKRPAFKPPKMSGSTTATGPSKLEQGKMEQENTSASNESKASVSKCTPLQAPPSGEADEGSMGGKDHMQESSKKKMTKPQPNSKAEKKSAKQEDSEEKIAEKEKKKVESEKKKLQQQQKKLEKQQRLEEKEAERERKRQDRERKEREREEKRQEKEKKAQERAQKKQEREVKKQDKEMKKQEQEKKRLGKEKQDKNEVKSTHGSVTLSPATLPTVDSRDSNQREPELTDMKDSGSDSRDAMQVDGGAEREEMEDESNGHVESITVSSDKDGDLDTTGKFRVSVPLQIMHYLSSCI